MASAASTAAAGFRSPRPASSTSTPQPSHSTLTPPSSEPEDNEAYQRCCSPRPSISSASEDDRSSLSLSFSPPRAPRSFYNNHPRRHAPFSRNNTSSHHHRRPHHRHSHHHSAPVAEAAHPAGPHIPKAPRALAHLFVAKPAADLNHSPRLPSSPPPSPPHCSSTALNSAPPVPPFNLQSSPLSTPRRQHSHLPPHYKHSSVDFTLPLAVTYPWALPPSPPSTRSSSSDPPSPTSESSTSTFDTASLASDVESNGSHRAPTHPRESVLMTHDRNPKMAASGRGDHLGQRTQTRTGVSSQHSSSVPSTPFQQPRDMAYRSDSPSPHRALGNRSPQSVVSEMNPPRSRPQHGNEATFCKFESGAEIRKRRIPYTEGGNEELPPHTAEPKKALAPHEEDKLSGDMRELYDRLLPSAESEDRRARLIKKLDTLLNEHWPNHDIRVNVFGSSGNLLSSSDSDVDICITTPLKSLESMHAIADLLNKSGMEKVVCRASAKVPIVKCWDPELELAADMNVNNPLALENTRMIRTYVQLDPRVRPLAKIIKYWTKRRYLNDAAYGGTISSYTWICMILNFLQRRDPPILPSLQKTQGKRLPTKDGHVSEFADDLDALKGYGDANKESLAELLFGFFRHYAYEFDYSKHVVSVREGRTVTRKEKGWHPSNYQEKEARNRLCVEEPFTVNRNLGNSADDYAWNGIHKEIRRAFELLADGCKLEEACEEYIFPLEEKPVFQRPAPKPAPVLRRSASQSGRPSHEQGSNRSRKNNRNASSQRTSNRRASSGASFANSRVNHGLPFSPTAGTSPMDYFATKGNLHDQLYQQYQYLQAQQDVLRSQLVQQQAAQQAQQAQQAHGRSSASEVSSPPQRGFGSGLASPRFFDGPQTAPLLPGYLFHYAAQYPRVPSLPQTRTRDGSATNPSSPSLNNSVPNLRRQAQRPPAPEGSPGSTRSQSQPGRSLPHPITLQQQAHPGYDVSGALPTQTSASRSTTHAYASGYPAMAFSPLGIHALHLTDNALPKEYVGYYINQSPALTPQMQPQGVFPSSQSQLPALNLRDPPQRQRRVTPELPLPIPNGRHNSRSPSPLGHVRGYDSPPDKTERPAESIKSRSSPPHKLSEFTLLPAVPRLDLGGPVIVNGSGPARGDKVNGLPQQPPSNLAQAQSEAAPPQSPKSKEANGEARESSKVKAPPRLNFAQHAAASGLNGTAEHFKDPVSASSALLSPVAEMRTPSPTRQLKLEKPESPTKQANGWAKTAQMGHQKHVGSTADSKCAPASGVKHERKVSAPSLTVPSTTGNAPWSTSKVGDPLASSPADSKSTPASSASNPNPWQQATGKKGHKKSRSSAGQKSSGGQQMPANESERKGG